MFLSLALCIFAQSQSFHWESDVDERYWHALHLLEVDNKPADAVEALRGLVDETSVIQFRGQAGIILAQTYRAMLRSGQLKEAAELLPLIRREVEGTEFKARAEKIVTLAQNQKSVQGEIDPEFLALVREQLLIPFWNHKDVTAKALAYGGRLSPYLLETIFNEPEKSNFTLMAFGLSASLGDKAVLFAVLKEFEYLDSDTVLHVLEGLVLVKPFSEQAASSWTKFLVELSQSEKVRVAQRAIDPLVQLAVTNADALVRLDSILEDSDSLLAPFVLGELLRDPAEMPASLLVKVIQGEDEIASGQMRAACYQGVALHALRVLAETGDMDARKSVLWYLLDDNPKSYSGTSIPGPRGRRSIKHEPQREDIEGDVSWFKENLKSNFRSDSLAGYHSKWQSFVKLGLKLEGEQSKLMAFMVALDNEDFESALEFLKQIPTPKNLALHLPAKWPVEFIPFLESVVASTEMGRMAAFRLMERKVPFDSDVFLMVLKDEELRYTVSDFLDKLQDSEVNMEFLASAIRNPGLNPRASYSLATKLVKSRFPQIEVLSQALSNNNIQPGHSEFVFGKLMETIRNIKPWEAMQDGNLASEDSKAMSDIFSLAFSSPWLSRSGQIKAMSTMRNLLEDLMDQGADVSSLLLPFLKEDETQWLVGKYFASVIKDSPELLRAVFEYQPEMIHAGNCTDFISGNGINALVLLEHPNPEIVSLILQRMFYVPGFELTQLPSHDKALLDCLSHPKIASNAAKYLVRSGAQHDFVPELIRAWGMPDLESRSTLMSAIGSIYDERLLPVILEGIQYPEQGVLSSAEKALARYAKLREQKTTLQAWQRAGREGNPADYLIKKLESEKLDVRIAAIESLGTMGAKEALPFLVGLLEDEDQDVAKASAVALKKINAASPKGDKED